MKKRQTLAQLLASLGSLVMLLGAALHLAAAYPKVSTALAASNLSPDLKDALRAVFALIGCNWIVVAIVTLIAAFTGTRIRKAIVLFTGFSLLAQIPIWVGIMGWFVGNEMFIAAAGFIVCGGLIFPPASTP
jgi:hypothetical protein